MHGEILQGARTDLDISRRMAKSGGMRLVTLSCTLQQIRCAEKYLVYHEDVRDWETEVTWIYGAPGVGKTVMAAKLAGDDDVYWKKTQSKWFCGYDAHEQVVIDDIRECAGGITFMMLIGLLDSKPMQVETKGGSRQFLAKRVFITSVEKPQHVYGTVGVEKIHQLMRRIDRVINMDAVPDVREVGRVIIDLPNEDTIPWSPPTLARSNLWGNSYPFFGAQYKPQEDLENVDPFEQYK